MSASLWKMSRNCRVCCLDSVELIDIVEAASSFPQALQESLPVNIAFEPLANALESIAAAIVGISPSHPHSLTATHGWNQVGLTLHDLAGFSSQLASDIREQGADEVDSADATLIASLVTQLTQFRDLSMPQFWGGNGVQVVPNYILTIEGVRARIRHLMPKYTLPDGRSLPAHLAKRITRVKAELDAIVVDRDALTESMRIIAEAHSTAETLPEDLASLKDARDKVEKLGADALRDAGEIEIQQKSAVEIVAAMRQFSDQAEKLVAQCEEAYRVTTSKGLAGAFDQRATGLTRSMQLWVLALIVALGAAAFLGGQRVELLSSNLGDADPKWGVIWLNIALSVLSVGAPMWFAWVATKQVGQRFRLAEDYGYKASIAKAYEGYRREAAKIDPEFSARLFGSSLTRLEEAPMRLMESASHGSPLHELFNSHKVQHAIATMPELRGRIQDVLAEAKQVVSAKPNKSEG